MYLGNLSFPEELSRSFSELLFIVSDMFGYLPLDYRQMKMEDFDLL